MSEQQNQISKYSSTYIDDIDLGELFSKVWGNRRWLVFSTTVFLCLAVIYLVFTTPVYQVNAFVRPPLDSDFSEVNLSGVMRLDSETAFNNFRRILDSKQLKKDFISSAGVIDRLSEKTSLSDQQLITQSLTSAKLNVPIIREDQFLVSDANSFTYQHNDPQFAAEAVNGLILAANNRAVKEFANEFEAQQVARVASIKKRISLLESIAKQKRQKEIVVLEEKNRLAIQNAEDKLAMLREKASRHRQDRIQQLTEAIKIAETLGIFKPTTLSKIASATVASNVSQFAVNTELKNAGDPLYLRGVEHLEAERDALLSRKDDDFSDPAIRQKLGDLELLRQNREVEALRSRESDAAFIMGEIAPLLGELQKLESIDIDFSRLHFMRVDQPAIVPSAPVKPKIMLTMLTASVIGSVLGFFVALLIPVKRKA